MLKLGQGECGSSLYYSCYSFVNLKLFLKKKERENRKIGEYSKKQVLHFYLSIGFSGKKERESV